MFHVLAGGVVKLTVERETEKPVYPAVPIVCDRLERDTVKRSLKIQRRRQHGAVPFFVFFRSSLCGFPVPLRCLLAPLVQDQRTVQSLRARFLNSITYVLLFPLCWLIGAPRNTSVESRCWWFLQYFGCCLKHFPRTVRPLHKLCLVFSFSLPNHASEKNDRPPKCLRSDAIKKVVTLVETAKHTS